MSAGFRAIVTKIPVAPRPAPYPFPLFMKAWLLLSDGKRVDVDANCQIGRMPGCAVRIDSNDVSRRHASIHVQQSEMGAEYWLADLGSTNGTVRNGRRLTIPCRLYDGDRIVVGDTQLVFRQDEESNRAVDDEKALMTVAVQAARKCWLLMVDIKNFTQVTLSMSPEVLGHRVGTWLRRTGDIIEGGGGIVDKFLGDALFAYWEAKPDSERVIAKVIGELQKLQAERSPDFRIVVHTGPVLLAGGAGGANNVSGLEVIYVFRMEKVASRLGLDTIASEPAHALLAPLLAAEPAGSHLLDGFSGERALFQILPAAPAGGA